MRDLFFFLFCLLYSQLMIKWCPPHYLLCRDVSQICMPSASTVLWEMRFFSCLIFVLFLSLSLFYLLPDSFVSVYLSSWLLRQNLVIHSLFPFLMIINEHYLDMEWVFVCAVWMCTSQRISAQWLGTGMNRISLVNRKIMLLLA
jgi:hypothetical protein